MAFSARLDAAPISGINVTPLVDVMLVLLIIFMISAPVVAHKTLVDLPSPNRSFVDLRPDPLRITVERGDMVFVDGMLVSEPVLEKQLAIAAARSEKPPIELHVRDDAAYEDVARVIATVKNQGLDTIDFAND
ncbi:MAG: Biopolymer transport protein ExbD [Luteibacter sp.]|uniref:ExbD/TolR family protein n=1 Tax=Luteibacter sp. TaxID=1886636 RepID=UPI001380DB38|nr:biopolymer transporter ExbD [Luteibacter sp.]KAF1008510.1 MAG: Biopolymer transport protein ExbD [Luteibacter sp.]